MPSTSSLSVSEPQTAYHQGLRYSINSQPYTCSKAVRIKDQLHRVARNPRPDAASVSVRLTSYECKYTARFETSFRKKKEKYSCCKIRDLVHRKLITDGVLQKKVFVFRKYEVILKFIFVFLGVFSSVLFLAAVLKCVCQNKG